MRWGPEGAQDVCLDKSENSRKQNEPNKQKTARTALPYGRRVMGPDDLPTPFFDHRHLSTAKTPSPSRIREGIASSRSR